MRGRVPIALIIIQLLLFGCIEPAPQDTEQPDPPMDEFSFAAFYPVALNPDEVSSLFHNQASAHNRSESLNYSLSFEDSISNGESSQFNECQYQYHIHSQVVTIKGITLSNGGVRSLVTYTYKEEWPCGTDRINVTNSTSARLTFEWYADEPIYDEYDTYYDWGFSTGWRNEEAGVNVTSIGDELRSVGRDISVMIGDSSILWDNMTFFFQHSDLAPCMYYASGCIYG